MIVNLWMSWMSILVKKTNTLRKTQKKQQPNKYLNIKMLTKGGPVFPFSLPPCQVRHCLDSRRPCRHPRRFRRRYVIISKRSFCFLLR